MAKYADDIILLIPSSDISACENEIRNIEQWSGHKNLHLNRAKSAEMIFHAKYSSSSVVPPLLPGIVRVRDLKILGVTISDDLKMSTHIKATLSSCEQSLYALLVMKTHGMHPSAIQAVFHATTLAKLL